MEAQLYCTYTPIYVYLHSRLTEEKTRLRQKYDELQHDTETKVITSSIYMGRKSRSTL
jgi:hypothetical protein